METCAHDSWCHSSYEFFKFYERFQLCFNAFVGTLLGHSMNLIFEVKYQTREKVFDHISKHEKRVENTTCSAVFLTIFEVFKNVVKHCIEYLIYLLNRS